MPSVRLAREYGGDALTQQRLAAFVDLLPEGAAFVSADGIVQAANDAMAARFGERNRRRVNGG